MTVAAAPPRELAAGSSQQVRLLLGWTVSRALLVTIVMLAVEQDALADIAGYYDWARGAWLHGLLPGRDFPSEYPPGALPFILLPATGQGPFGYLRVFASVLMLFDGAVLLALLRSARATGDGTAVLTWTWGPVLLGPVFLERFDLVPAALAALALVALRQRPGLAAGLLTAAASIKVWPVALMTSLAARPTAWRRSLLTAAGVALGVVVASLAAGVQGAWGSTLGQQSGRGLQVEAVAATPFTALRSLGGPHPVFRHGSWEVSNHGTVLLGNLVWWIGAAGLGLLLLVVARRLAQGATIDVTLVGATATAVLLVVDKALSPQYLTWLLAMVAVAARQPFPRRRAVLVLTLVAAGLTHVVYPLTYTPLLHGAVLPLLALTARNAALVAVALLLVRLTLRTGRPA